MSNRNEPAPRRGGERRERAGGDQGRPRRATPRPGRQPGPRRPPARAAGGVQSGVGEHWWTARWLAALERLGWSMRLQRGQAYARAGSVLRIDVQPGQITAAVKGSQPRPYRVIIRIAPLTDAEWERVTDKLAAHALFAARLLAGEMPPTIEDAFAEAGVTLFPTSAGDLYATCTCPDWANPCKHVAAVHSMLGAEFDRDPFLLFWLRGRSRQQIIEALRQKRMAVPTEAPAEAPPPAVETLPEPEPPAAPPLSECLEHFWQPGASLNPEQFRVSRPEVPESVLRRLGPPPFWRGEYEIMPVLVDAYRTISREAYALAHPEEQVERPALLERAPTPVRPTPAAAPPGRERPRPPRERERRPGGERAAPPGEPPAPAAKRPERRRRWPRPHRPPPPAAEA